MENYTDDKMDELLVKYLADETTPPEQTMVEEWIHSSETNRHYFQHFQLIWNETQKLAATTVIDENKAWLRFQRRVKKSRGNTVKVKPFGWWRIAAAILILAGAAWFTRSIINKEPTTPEMRKIISANEVKKDTLPDGSFATLNKHSELSYSPIFKGKTRKVKLKGEAFFDVKPNKEKPFIINVNDIQVKVVGTSFNIKTVNGLTEVIVETGMVQVIKGNEVIELKAGERVSLAEENSTVSKEVSKDKLYSYYVSRSFVCDNTPLWKLVEKLNEAYNADIRIGREELRKIPLTVTFDDESLDTILKVISQTLMIKVIKTGNEIILQ